MFVIFLDCLIIGLVSFIAIYTATRYVSSSELFQQVTRSTAFMLGPFTVHQLLQLVVNDLHHLL